MTVKPQVKGIAALVVSRINCVPFIPFLVAANRRIEQIHPKPIDRRSIAWAKANCAPGLQPLCKDSLTDRYGNGRD